MVLLKKHLGKEAKKTIFGLGLLIMRVLLGQDIKEKEESISKAFTHAILSHRGPYYILAWVLPSSGLPPSLLIIPTFPSASTLKIFCISLGPIQTLFIQGSLDFAG